MRCPPARKLRPGRPATVRADRPDRKSTRLNSSHQIISYAVFCLKKKKHTSELQSPHHLVCRLLLEKKNKSYITSVPNCANALNTNGCFSYLIYDDIHQPALYVYV